MLDMFHDALVSALPVLGTAAAGWIAWLLKTKFRLQITAEQNRMLAEICEKAIRFSGEWAHKQTKANASKVSPSGEAKMAQAVAFTQKELARVGIKIPAAQIDDLLHAALGAARAKIE